MVLIAAVPAVAAFCAAPPAPRVTRISMSVEPTAIGAAFATLATAAAVAADPSARQPAPYLDRALSRQLVFNQLAVGYTIWTGGYGAQILSNDVHLDRPAVWLVGTLGALPILAVNRAIEKSDASIFTGLNLSTNSIVQRLFGAVHSLPPPLGSVWHAAACWRTRSSRSRPPRR